MICKVQGVKSFSMPESALSFLQIYFAVGQQGTLTLTLCPPHSYSLLFFSPPPVWGCVVPPPFTSPFPHNMHFSLIYFLFFPLHVAGNGRILTSLSAPFCQAQRVCLPTPKPKCEHLPLAASQSSVGRMVFVLAPEMVLQWRWDSKDLFCHHELCLCHRCRSQQPLEGPGLGGSSQCQEYPDTGLYADILVFYILLFSLFPAVSSLTHAP